MKIKSFIVIAMTLMLVFAGCQKDETLKIDEEVDQTFQKQQLIENALSNLNQEEKTSLISISFPLHLI